MIKVFLLICCLCAWGFSAEVDADSSIGQVSSSSSLNIPLPHQTSYTGKGMSVGIGAGVFNPSENCDCMGVWQAQGEFFYTDWLSAGADIRFFGGTLDSSAMILYQRYRLNGRIHFPSRVFDFFFTGVLGLETTDISEFRDEWHHRSDDWWRPGENQDSVESVESCEKMFSLDGFSVGAGVGAGWRITDFLGATGNVLFEYNFSGAQLLSLTPGLAFDLKSVWPWAASRMLSVWVSVECEFQRYFNRGVDEWAGSILLGVQVGI